MARVGINTGSTANDGTGDSLRAAGGIINSNFSEIYSQLGDGTNLSATWEKTSAGINSTANVGIGTTNPQFQLEVGYAGVADTSLFVHGNARVTGILTVGASSIVIDGSKNEVLIGTGVSLNGTTGIISATQVYAGGTLLTGGSGGSADSFWVEEGSTGITTTKNVGIATDSAPSALTVGGQSLFLGITTFRENVILSNPNSGASNNLNFGGDAYIDQSSGDTFTFQINTGSDTNTTDGSFVFRNTEPNTDPIPDFQLDALRIYTRGDYWNGMVRSYTDFHADQNAFVGGDLQVGAASTLIGAGNTLGSFKVGAGGTVISTSASGLVGIGSSVPSVELDVSGNVSVSSSVTAASFHGDGSKLTGVVASGTGVVVKDGGSLVGTAGTINFADNISVSTLSGAAVTITVSAASTADVRTNTFAASGVSTFSNNVTVDGGDVTFTSQGDKLIFTADAANPLSGGAIEISTSGSGTAEISGNGNQLRIYNNQDANHSIAMRAGEYYFQDESADYYALFSSGAVKLYHPDTAGGVTEQKFETTGGGIDVTGHTETDTLQVSGVSTFSGDVEFSGTSGSGTDGIYWDQSTGNLRFNEQREAQFGNSQELRIYRSIDGNSYIQDSGSGDLKIISNGDSVSIQLDNTETMGKFITNGAVELYYDNSKKFETSGIGVTITGQADITGHVALSTSLTVAGISTFDVNTSQSVEFRNTLNSARVAVNMDGSSNPQIQFISSDNDTASISGDSNANMVIAAGNTLNLRANTSDVVLQAAGNNTDIYAHNARKLTLTSSGIEVAGIVTAISGVSTFYGDVSKAAAGRWYLGAGAGNTSYFFTGIGFTSVDYAHNPVIHLARGQRYEFVNEMNAHPFQIQSGSVGGDPYDPGVTNNNSQNGTIAIEVPFNAPNELFYQCTSHSGMGGTFTIYPSI